MADSKLFLSPWENLPITLENKYCREIFLFYHENVCCVFSLELQVRPLPGRQHSFVEIDHEIFSFCPFCLSAIFFGD